MADKETFLGAAIWKRFKKNKPGIFGLIIISFAFIVAILGYIISPDNTPNADLQAIEIQAKTPGYKQLFLKIYDSINTTTTLAEKLFEGTPNSFKYIPINSYTIKGNDLLVEKYIDDDTSIQQLYNINLITNNKPNKLQEHFIVKKYWLGTDGFGRDILSRIIIGTRVSLSVGLIAVLIAVLVGVFLGAIAGYYRGWVDEVVMWLVNITWSIPTLLLVFAFTIAIGKGFWQIFIAVGLTMWVSVARLVRGQVMAIRNLEFIQAARIMGFSDIRIIIKHILPNILGPLMVITASIFASAIIIEAGLSFLGIGVQPPQPSWGLMIKENYTFIITNKPMLALIPGIAIMLLVLAFNLLGNGLRDAMDVKSE